MRLSIPLMGMLLSLPPAARAQEPGSLEVSRIPREGKAPEDFVPAGWKIEKTTRGDLDKSGSEDVVLQLMDPNHTHGRSGEEELGAHPRALVVLLLEGDKLHRVAALSSSQECRVCAGREPGPQEGGEVRIQKGILIFSKKGCIGSSTLRYRYDPKDKRFVLIGVDEDKGDFHSGDRWKTSDNRLTGVRLTEHLHFDEDKEKLVSQGVEKEKVHEKTAYLEDGDLFCD